MSTLAIVFTALLVILIIAPLLMHFIPAINFRGMPQGLIQGALTASKPNWVSSLVPESDSHYVAPLTVADLSAIKDCVVRQSPKTTLVKLDESSLIAYRQSPVFNFTDWLIIRKDGQVTSSATMGYYDFGKNREWVESLRAHCTVPSPR
ncbi:DUF1499 domain-containing protein [Legionella taurinensis]|uniref:DUF1499 domain-containing protein n=1 Tax=Legionella taurinensis TaxID=70611 RepID=A0A3A5LIC0_9GAMM|nr:DUF1499 domain-containing protein [Legionella taurinensis]MDX1838586.1 DUF1499 domain-containing protein [Legionella taurinensis]PUT39074.1 DUF1499 domain-containing protein [Legionella taurinensis]PUT41160.1 DUF1499 domain-containing protein [Legionella taurinensis]PUT43535.1 DUF1499 domain-containing protein [Legionella taurinensis]PUT46552.1 DUF1499 domain-containing protein [Legionella taurinensis]